MHQKVGSRVTSGVTTSALADHQNDVLEEFATRPLFYLIYQYQLTTNAVTSRKDHPRPVDGERCSIKVRDGQVQVA